MTCRILFITLSLTTIFLSIPCIPSPAYAQNPQYKEGEVIVKFKPGQTPKEIEENVARRENIRKTSVVGTLQLSVEDAITSARGENPPEDKLKDITNARKEAEIINQKPLSVKPAGNQLRISQAAKSALDTTYVMQTRSTQSVDSLKRTYEALPEVEYAEPNYLHQASQTSTAPNDFYYSQMWNLEKIRMPEAWGITRGSDIKVAVLDTGIDTTHPELGNSQITERPMERLTSNELLVYAASESTVSIDQNRIAYISDDKIYIRHGLTPDPLTRTQIIPLYSNDLAWPVTITLKDNLLVYAAVGRSQEFGATSGLFVYNLTTNEHRKIANTTYITSIAITNGKVFYSRRDNTTPPDVFISGLYMYDPLTRIETRIDEDYIPVADNGKVAYPVPDFTTYRCYEKAKVFDIATNRFTDLYPPDIGPILDFKNNKILYQACSKTNFDPTWSTFYIYDITNGSYTRFRTGSVNAGGQTTHTEDWLVSSRWSAKGSLENNIVFVSKGSSNNRIVAYDRERNRTVHINVAGASADFEAEGNKVCFIGQDKHIYCHTYNPSDSYPYPVPNIYNSRVVDGYSFADQDSDARDFYGHGTHVAGTIGALTNNSIGISGINWNVQLLAVKVLNDYGSGHTVDIVAGIYYAADNGAKVINMSLGGDYRCAESQSLQDAISYAVSRGVTVVVAAGNENADANNSSPASCNNVITVAATGPDDERASFSNYGSAVDVAAPGGNARTDDFPDTTTNPDCFSASRNYLCRIRSTTPNNTYRLYVGTSMATPHAAGAAALLLAQNPSLTPDQIETALKNSGDSIATDQPIGKRLNMYTALQLTSSQTPAPTSLTPTSSQAPSLTPTPTLNPADINRNGSIDMGDFGIWQCEFVSTTGVCPSPSSTRSADINSDNTVDVIDFGLWRNLYSPL